ncbi:peptidase M16 [Clostridium carboxidivorans P7]|uniref:Peptidase M16 domain protein n=1 Tax=Clostridium carboxidivorans P7 TaxID=536227 RepID=C6Q037_9CLOT|nr:pitrilysin family protein [Clostridium carboxidivorans]AKN33889.1 peptidase M16 [Clostridium carboxidivorans P7]EET85148.1 peptidase M16 domain protein [Clostridium carboxidivorans P7]EFG86491.1 peptidase M16 inactive domain protein [Clostridium carboxidivorans P7]
MKKMTLENGMKLIYEHREGDLSSFCIAFNGGALEETGRFKLGTAHAVEHMISKGTKSRNEEEINKICSEIFGFENAMTNFSYVIYYGTCLSEDFEKGLEVYSDIILNPTFPEKGFKEEMNIILEELKEWKDDMYQYCEDTLLYNSFSSKRIRNRIIGTEEDIKDITLDEIKKFYNTYYNPKNCAVAVCSSLDFEYVINIVNNFFGNWGRSFHKIIDAGKEKNKEGLFVEKLTDIEGAKIQYLFSIDELNEEECRVLNLFNSAFGEGTNSIIFDEIRTKNGLAYDVKSYIKNERGVKNFIISMGTSAENVDKAINLINEKIREIKNKRGYFNTEKIKALSKNIKLKRQLKLERAIQLCKELSTYEIMYDDAEKLYKEVEGLENINEEKIIEVINKVLNNPSIQVITSK